MAQWRIHIITLRVQVLMIVVGEAKFSQPSSVSKSILCRSPTSLPSRSPVFPLATGPWFEQIPWLRFLATRSCWQPRIIHIVHIELARTVQRKFRREPLYLDNGPGHRMWHADFYNVFALISFLSMHLEVRTVVQSIQMSSVGLNNCRTFIWYYIWSMYKNYM